MARPTILNDDFIEEFCLKLRLSDSVETAIAQMGCGRQSFYRWKRHVSDGGGTKLEHRLMEAVDKSQAETKMRVEYAFSELFDKSWRPIAWWLERKYPREYGRKRPLPVQNPDAYSEPDQFDRIVWSKSARVKTRKRISQAKPTDASPAAVLKAFESVSYTWVPGNYFESLGLEPLIGRLLTTEDDGLDAPPVAVITEAYWARRFERNPSVIGRSAQIEGLTVTVVGVSPTFKAITLAPGADVTMANGVMPRVPPAREARAISWGEPEQASVTSPFREPGGAESVSPTPSMPGVG